MIRTPRISVVTCVYNRDRFLAQAIESILSQTLTDFEYVLVDDGSQESTAQILASYAAHDRRIVLLRSETNCGINHAANRGLQAARGEYVANLDSDDLAMPERLSTQASFLDQHPNIGVAGSFIRNIGENDQLLSIIEGPTEPDRVRWDMLFRCSVFHSAAMMRRALAAQAGGYSPYHRYVTEYELFSRLIRRTELTNIPAPLAAYRSSDANISGSQWGIQHGEVTLLQYAMCKQRLGLNANPLDIDALYRGTRREALEDQQRVGGAAQLLETIYRRYLEVESPDASLRAYIRTDCGLKLFRLALQHQHLSAELDAQLMQRALQFDPALLSNLSVQAKLAESITS